MKKSSKPTPQMQKLKPAIWVISIFFTFTAVTTFLSTAVSYPTDKHREVAHQITETSPVDKNGEQSKAYQQLLESPEARFSMAAQISASTLSFLLSIGLLTYAYRRLRRERVVKSPLQTTAIGATVGTLAATPVALLYERFFVGEQGTYLESLIGITGHVPLLTVIMSFTMITALAFAFTYGINVLIVYIIQLLYNRKRNFVIDE